MSTGGLFQLMINKNSQDRMLLATKLLDDRLKEIRRARCKDPSIRDTNPTLVDIEKTHILFINAHFKPYAAIAYEYQKTPPNQGEVKFGSDVTYSIPQYGDFFNDMMINVVLENLTVGDTSTQVRYCDFPGHRILKKTTFEVNNIILDEYSSDAYNVHYNFYVPPNKERAYKKCVGQEVPELSYLTQNPGVDEYREAKFLVNGAQTPKQTHERLEMNIPLLFWFNLDPRLSIPSVAIPYGQRFIKIEIEDVDKIAQGFDTPDFTPPKITTMDLYINNIFVNPEIHDLFIKRVGFNMIRIHKEERANVSESANNILFQKLKFPTETFYIGIKPDINQDSMTDWHKFYQTINNTVAFPVAVPNPGIPPPTYILGFSTSTYQVPNPVIDTLRLEAYGIDIYTQNNMLFYNSYLPLTYGGAKISSPRDIGLAQMTLNLFPGSYQPSGYINLSAINELYIGYESSVINSTYTGTMYVLTVSMNFLLIANGSAVLRYNT